jgi:hypothetical protein
MAKFNINGMTLEEFLANQDATQIPKIEGDVVCYSCGTMVSNGKVLNPGRENITIGNIKGSMINIDEPYRP